MERWQSCSLLYNGDLYDKQKVEEGLPESSGIEHDFFRFLEEWFDDSPFMTVHTSGSTGIPKEIKVKKEQMMNSALNTCSFLGIVQNNSILLCMSLQYIAGKMVVVRALTCNLQLVLSEPSGHPLKEIQRDMDFVAMVPLQVFNSLQNDLERERLKRIKNLIIGGGTVSEETEKELRSFPNPIYSTYGMTETLSHIALRRLNGESASSYYYPFPSVHISLSVNHTLVINAPDICDSTVETNDIVEINQDGTFIVIGRKDNVINSGGVKIQAEEVEKALRPLLENNYAITSVADIKFGEAVVLLVEHREANKESLFNIIKTILPKFQQPKYIFSTTCIPMTETGKINRAECKKLANSFLTSDSNKHA